MSTTPSPTPCSIPFNGPQHRTDGQFPSPPPFDKTTFTHCTALYTSIIPSLNGQLRRRVRRGGSLGQKKLQHPVLVLGRAFAHLDRTGQPEPPRELHRQSRRSRFETYRPEGPLRNDGGLVVFAFRRLLRLHLACDCDDVVIDGDGQVVLRKSRRLCGDREGL